MRKRPTQPVHISRLRALFRASSVQYVFAARNASHRAIVVSNRSGNYQLHAVDFSTGFRRQVTRAPHGAIFGSISPDGRYIYVLNDESGGEHGHFVRVPFSGGKALDVTPNLKQYFSYSISPSDDAKTLCFTAALGNKNRVFVATEGKGGAWAAREVYAANTSLSEAVCSPDGALVCVAETGGTKGDFLVLLRVDGKAPVPVRVRSRWFDAVSPLAFSRVSARPAVLALSRTRGWYRPLLYDFARGRVSGIQHASFRGDVWVLRWDEARGYMILCDVHNARQKLYFYNTNTQHLKCIGPRTGSFNIHFDSVISLGCGSFITKWNDFNAPPCLVEARVSRPAIWEKTRRWPGHVAPRFAMESVRARSSDGERVQMWVALPLGAVRPAPFIIDVHGGPHGVVGDEFSPEAHAWLKSGFGYCAVNYRGSISFGRRFERKIYGAPGKWEVEDVVAARNWLVRRGYADGKQIALCGWSWGGYVILLALGKYPDLWNCGIAGAAIGDCVMQYEDEPACFKALDREMFKGTPKTARARYVRSSPVTYAGRIQAPILVMHGRNDARCLPRQIKHFIDVLRSFGKRVSVEWFSSGHVGEFTDTALRVKLMSKAIQFAVNERNKIAPHGRMGLL